MTVDFNLPVLLTRSSVMRETMPMEFCDLECRHARFPDSDSVDGSRSCRTFVALFCTHKKRLVHKNMPCDVKAMPKKRRGRGN